MSRGKIRLKKNASKIYNLDSLLNYELTLISNEIETYNDALLKQYETNSLHNLRVNLRKLLSFVHFFKKEIPLQEWNYVCKIIKKIIKPTSKVRDFDVFNEYLIVPAYNKNKKLTEYQNLYVISDKVLIKLHEDLINYLQSN